MPTIINYICNLFVPDFFTFLTKTDSRVIKKIQKNKITINIVYVAEQNHTLL